MENAYQSPRHRSVLRRRRPRGVRDNDLAVAALLLGMIGLCGLPVLGPGAAAYGLAAVATAVAALLNVATGSGGGRRTALAALICGSVPVSVVAACLAVRLLETLW